jgi:hypothetical protein
LERAKCLIILNNCHRAMPPEARLLIIEMVLAEGDTPQPGKILDVIMLTIPGGQGRTEPEYRELLDKAGFRLTRVVPTQSAVSVVEAGPSEPIWQIGWCMSPPGSLPLKYPP